MSKALLDKLRKSREFNVPVNGHTFTVRRPTDADVVLEKAGARRLDFIHNCVVGWDLKELDVVPGGGPEPVPFDAELWAAWVDDRPECWDPIGTAIIDAYKDHAAKQKDDEKNSQPGSIA